MKFYGVSNEGGPRATAQQHVLVNLAAVGAAHHQRGGGGRHADVAESEAVVETDVIDVCAGGAAANGEGQVGVGDGDDGDVKED